MDDNLFRAFTGGEIEVILLQGELEENGISSTTQYGSTSGVNPIYGGAPVELDLLINQSDLDKAIGIIEKFLESGNPAV
jgi:hypothetical protein